MDVILFIVKWQFAPVYLNDIVIFSMTPEQHLGHVREIPSLFYNAGATLKLKKCHFFTNTIDDLGHVISSKRLILASHTKDDSRKLKPQTSLSVLRPFLTYTTSLDNSNHASCESSLCWNNN